MRKRARGSLTIYSTLTLMLILSALLTFFEGARYQEMLRFSQLQTQLAIESVFANYNSVLWENYHLLACNQLEMDEILVEIANGKMSQDEMGMNLLLLEVDSVDITGYTLLTDGGGSAYVQSASTYMEENILYEAAVRIYSQYESVYELKENSQLDMTNIDTALETLDEAQEAAEESSSTGTSGQTQTNETVAEEELENPLEDAKTLLDTGVLELVIQDTSQISNGEMDLSNVVSVRTLNQGVNSQIPESNWYDKVLFQQYLLGYMSCYTNPLEGRCMNYELEYLLGGKSSDVENLKVVVTQLLLIRTISNFLYLTTDSIKVEEAYLFATAIAGASLNPTLIEVVKIGLLTAWAFGEGVLDVRALLAGKKIPLIKSSESWTLELENIGSISEEYLMAEESEWGICYTDYLGIMLLFEEENTIALHAMDIQEAITREEYGMPDFRMDELVVQAEVKMQYNQRFITTAEFAYY